MHPLNPGTFSNGTGTNHLLTLHSDSPPPMQSANILGKHMSAARPNSCGADKPDEAPRTTTPKLTVLREDWISQTCQQRKTTLRQHNIYMLPKHVVKHKQTKGEQCPQHVLHQHSLQHSTLHPHCSQRTCGVSRVLIWAYHPPLEVRSP